MQKQWGCGGDDYLDAQRRVVEVPEDGGQDEARDHHRGQAHQEQLRGALDVLPRPQHQHRHLRPPRIRESAHRRRIRLTATLHRKGAFTRQQFRIQQHARHGRVRTVGGRRRLRFRLPRSAELDERLDALLRCVEFLYEVQGVFGAVLVSRNWPAELLEEQVEVQGPASEDFLSECEDD